MKNRLVLFILLLLATTFFSDGRAQSLDWIKTGQSITPDNNGHFGHDVCISDDGSTLLTCGPGLPCSTRPNSSIQLAQAFTWNGSEWVRRGQNLGPINHYLGWSIDMNNTGNLIVAGELCATLEGYTIGGVKAFQWDGNEWSEKGDNIYPVQDIRDRYNWIEGHFGWQVEISDDGNVIVVGAPEYRSKNGAIKAFNWNGQRWMEMGNEIIGISNATLGTSLALNGDGNRLVARSRARNSVKTYDWNGIDWMEVGVPLSGGSISTGGCFGCSLSLRG